MALGIDFGTSNSTVALAGAGLLPVEGAALTIPSAVFWGEEGEVLHGRAAIAAYVEGEDGRLMRALKTTLSSGLIHDKTRLGGRPVALRTVLARYIAQLRDAALPHDAGRQAVFGRPVAFMDDDPEADRASQATLGEIAREVGFTDVAFQFEPIAAALAYEATVPGEELVLIVDIGGGTSDFSVVRVSPERARAPDRAGDILANAGTRVGGTDFDRALSLAEVMPALGFGTSTFGGKGLMPRHYYLDLATWHRINLLYTERKLSEIRSLVADADLPERVERLVRVVAERHGHGLALRVEAAKMALTEHEVARLDLHDLTDGPNPLVRRAGFEAAIAPLLGRIETKIAEVLRQAGVAPEALSAVFLTGGSAQLPALAALVARALPGVAQKRGDMLGSVGAGLALDAARKFGPSRGA